MKRASLSLLTVCGLEELDGLRASGVTHVLSILDPGTPDPEPFRQYGRHHRTTLRFHDIVEPMGDLILPERNHVEQIIAFGEELAEDRAEGHAGHLLIHCHMGISRSTAAMLMMLRAAYPDETDDDAVQRLVAIRPQAWPNLRMTGFADDLLGRGGELSRAVSRLHARQIAARPQLADTFRRLGRSLEVERAAEVAKAA
ncbi:protein-tyrosine-phosphatase [Enterovirga sp.]|uniref:tyrosine phosphatase family protein n=1 Tax=Enterovirga sp. TaxID=2026350 RepID=UPI0026327F0E|nr:protein-tyrosine-phosphatase [Enterovirga sp.]MDB5591770.1 protein-tyrosine-phosphatase [Enterovirga sp.]